MARSFNGSSDFINLGTPPSLETSSLGTLSCWFNPSSFPSSGNLVDMVSMGGFDGGVNVGAALDIFNNSGTLQLRFTGGNNSVPWSFGGAITTNTWGHALGTVNVSSNTITIYFNGVSEATTNASATTPVKRCTIGAFDNNGTIQRFWPGQLADVAFWNVVLTQGEITALANGARPKDIRPSALLGYWPVDGLQSPEPDLSGNKNNGTLTGTALAAGPPVMPFTRRGANALFAPTLQPFGSGVSGSRKFSASTDVIRPTFFDPSTPGGNTSYSLSMWYRPTSTSGVGTLIQWGDSSSNAALFFSNNGASGWEMGQQTRGAVASGFGALTGGTWYHLAFTYNGGSGANTLYQNGSLGNNLNTFQIPTSTNLYIGNTDGGGSPAVGDIADLCVWYNLILSSAEILALSKGARPYSIRPSFIKAWWPLNALSGRYPEPELSGNANNGAVIGTTPDSGPPVMQFTPRWPQFNFPPSAAPTFLPAWALNRNRVIEGVAT